MTVNKIIQSIRLGGSGVRTLQNIRFVAED